LSFGLIQHHSKQRLFTYTDEEEKEEGGEKANVKIGGGRWREVEGRRRWAYRQTQSCLLRRSSRHRPSSQVKKVKKVERI